MAGLTRLSRSIVAARLILIVEYLAHVLWAPLSIAALFVGLAGLDVLPGLNRWLHAVIVALFAAALTASLRQGFIRHKWPRRADVWRKLERDNGLTHRPFEALADKPVIADPGLWQEYQTQLAHLVRYVRVLPPVFGIAFHDIRSIRAIAFLVLAIGLFAGHGRMGERLDAALSPPVLGETSPRAIAFNIWIKPPDYTGAPPIVLTRDKITEDTIEVPAGSTIEAHVSGGTARPHLVQDGKRQKFQALDRHNFEIGAPLSATKRLVLTQGLRTLGSWQISIDETVPPVIVWISNPIATAQDEVKLDFTAADQYGIAGLQAHIVLAEEVRAQMLPKGSALDTPNAAEIAIDIPVTGHPKSLKQSSGVDWTANRWAGFPVHLSLTASSVDGLSSTTPAQDLILPERTFTNPIAKTIIAQRKRLILDPVGERLTVAGKIAQLTTNPADLNNDPVIFLVLRSAATRLWRDPGLADFPNIENMLWQAAIKLEDGVNPEADKSLAAAESALKQALEQGAPPSEIARLTDNLKQALNQALDQMEKNLAQRLARGEAVPMAPPGAQMTSRNDLNALIDRLKSLSEKGDTEGAKKALSELQQTMQNLHDQASRQPDQKSMEAAKAMQQLHDLINRQQALMDKTYRRSQGDTAEADEFNTFNRDPFDPRRRHKSAVEDTGAEDQLRLRSDLEAIHKQLDELGVKIPPGVKDAEEDMGRAGQNLNEGEFAQALPQQQDALDKLRQSQQSMSEEIAKNGGGGGMMMGRGEGGAPGGGGQDPLGRPLNGKTADEDVKIPDQDDQARSRAVLEELRKRAGDRTRSKAEHSYIEDLLKNF